MVDVKEWEGGGGRCVRGREGGGREVCTWEGKCSDVWCRD